MTALEAAVPAEVASPCSQVVVAIVNYKTAGLVIDCLRSLADERVSWPDFDVLVSDNDSQDRSSEIIAEAIAVNGWQEWARVLPLPRNGGFGYGNNRAIDAALARPVLPRYVWLLNSDTIVKPGAGKVLTDFLDQHSDAGIAGSRLEDLEGPLQISAFRFLTLAGEFEAAARTGFLTGLLARWTIAPPAVDHNAECDWVAGASMMVRSDLLQKIGGFDEGYFLYFEETDLCLRANRAGFKCYYVPASRIVHLVGSSTGVTSNANLTKRRAPYWFQSRHRYFVKNHGRVYAALADGALILGLLVWRTRCVFAGRPIDHPQHFISDLLRYGVFARQ